MRLKLLSIGILCLLGAVSLATQAEIVEKRTTHATLAEKNLDHSLERARRLSKAQPNSPSAAKAVVDLLLMRLQFYRDYADLDELQSLCERWHNDTRAQAQYLCADVYAARHDFSTALGSLATASDNGGSCWDTRRRINAIGATLQIDVGPAFVNAALPDKPSEKKSMSYEVLVAQAALETARGNAVSAIAHYQQAVTNYADVSPYPVAWAWYQVAELLRDTDAVAATAYYAEALKYLPDYIAPRVELASLQLELGQTERALDNLGYAAARSEDPDIHGLIASTPAGTLPQVQRDNALKKATTGFSKLLERHPYAFADHAAEVYAVSDAKEAQHLRTLLKKQKSVVQSTLANWSSTNCSGEKS